MGKASSKKSVARARQASRRPSSRSKSRSWVWPGTIAALVVLGAALVVVSRGGQAEASPPLIGDHWHAAYGVNVCGQWQPPLEDAGPDDSGIHTHGDGLIHIHPFSTRYTGDGANLGAFADMVDLELDDDRLTLPSGETYETGDDCGGRPGRVQVEAFEGPGDPDGELLGGDFADHALGDGEVVVIAFVPEGTETGLPPTVPRLQDPNAAEERRPLVPIEGPQAATPDGSTTTSAPGPGPTTSSTTP
jgi:hypothetical protein